MINRITVIKNRIIFVHIFINMYNRFSNFDFCHLHSFNGHFKLQLIYFQSLTKVVREAKTVRPLAWSPFTN